MSPCGGTFAQIYGVDLFSQTLLYLCLESSKLYGILDAGQRNSKQFVPKKFLRRQRLCGIETARRDEKDAQMNGRIGQTGVWQ